MRLSLFALCRAFALSIVLVASLSQAQVPTSTRDRVTGPTRPRGDAARTDPLFRRTVACTVERQPGRTRNLLQTIPGTRSEALIVGSFQSRLDQCIPNLDSIGFTWNLLRGGVAEVYYQRNFPSGLPRGVEPTTELTEAWVRPRVEQNAVTALEAAHSAARCVVMRRPGLVSDLLATDPLSPAEIAAIRSLQPDISACLDSGVQFAATWQSIRGLLAEAALHYGEAQRNGFRQAIRTETQSH